MNILVTGGKGLLAHAIRVATPEAAGFTYWDIEEFDLTRPDMVWQRLRELRPAWVINTAAYNLVDRCEQERDLSWAVNARGPESLAESCGKLRIPLVHFSSDYVFDGQKQRPYVETDPPNPLNHYGAGKLHGERAVLAASPANIVIRTSWLFGSHPTQSKTFVHTVLRLAGAGKALRSTTDQVAAPTYAPDLARCVLTLVRQGNAGLFHAVNDEGISRYDWTLAILDAARECGLLQGDVPPVEPVLTSFFGDQMRRPTYSVLDNGKVNSCLPEPLGTWRSGLKRMLLQLS